jgi:VWFA-related protein
MTSCRDRLRRSDLFPAKLVLATLALLTLSARAQAPQAQEPPTFTMRMATHMVLVDAVITDKQGKAVTGLTPDDFQVEENGKAQKISSLSTPAENSPPPVPGLPPGIYSNRPQYRSTGAPITLMLLDALNTTFSDQAYARGQMLAFVKSQYKPGQRMGIFTLTGPLNVLQDFTADPQVLYSALQTYKASQQAFTPESVQGSLHAFESVSLGYEKDQRAMLTLDALNSLTRILGGLPGRKNLIWVTGDIPFTLIPEDRNVTSAELAEDLPSFNTRRVDEHASGNYAATFRSLHAEEIREVESRLSSAQVAVYPVDARGLSISLATDSQETMREVARETGGRAYVNQNEVKDGVERAFEDESASYTLGYYPDNKKYDGKYRQIKVKVKRDGVEVQCRRGYYAIDPTQIKGYNPQAEVVSALGDIVPATLVAFSAQVKPPSSNSVKDKIGVTFLVDANTISVEDASGGKHLNVAMYATIYSPAGKMLANRSQKVDQTFDASTYQQILQRGLMLHMDLDPQPGTNQIRLAVQDAHTGAIGTIDAPAP